MKIVCDSKIPYIRETLEGIADEVVFLHATDIKKADLTDADALIVRTRTRCDAELLEGSKVRFVGTATIGFDHIDTEYLAKRGIFWTNCPGCNSGSVCQYVRECLKAAIHERAKSGLRSTTMAVIGHGHVGSKVARMAKDMGLDVYVYDPLLFPEQTFDKVYDCDIITFHTPLTKDGPYPTYHMADRGFFRRLTKKPVIINAARGPVIDTAALIDAKDRGIVSELVIDTWENEPNISRELLKRCFIATPHIAGYSANGKVNADNMIVRALCDFFNLPHPAEITPPSDGQIGYNPMSDHNKLMANPELFERFREEYPVVLETSTPL
ncbi:MAG: 4-phosphoerythronate dehydrogenase [Bacteroidaceae bacterium]|nr:4-phosphoerythronate dehydrogenase [Bacteroidaceae bacterium]